MRSAFSTIVCMEKGYQQIIDLCKEHALNGVEIYVDKDNSVFGLSDKEVLERVCLAFEDSQIAITNLTSRINIKQYEKDILESTKRLMEFAHILKAKGLCVYLDNFKYCEGISIKPDYDGLVCLLRQMCEMAKQNNIELWIDTHNEFATGKVLNKVIEDVAYDNLKIVWDILQTIEAGEDIEETWQFVGSRIAHVRLKDGYNLSGTLGVTYYCTWLGDGCLPIYSILELLKKYDYDGYVSLDWDKSQHPELEKYRYELNTLLARYKEYLQNYKDNLLAPYGDKWERIDSSGKEQLSVFSVSKYGTEAIIDNRVSYATLKKYMYEAEITPGITYRVSVPFREEDTRGLNCVYAMVSVKSREGNITRRMYLERAVPGQLSLVFRAEKETRVRLELGIKSAGKIIWYRPSLQEWKMLEPRIVRLASVYLGYKTPGFPYKENLKCIEKSFDKVAAGVDLVGYAEDINTWNTDESQAFESLDGPFCTLMKRKAKEHSCYVFFTLHELDEYGCKRNTAVLIDRKGNLVGKCSKSHLTIREYEEGLIPGDSYPVFDTDFGKVGMLICWDAYFPEPAREMTLQGAEILLISTAGNPHFRHIAIAKENGVHVLVSCRKGDIKPDECVAPTKIISPCGEILAQCNVEGEAAITEIDLNSWEGIRYLSVGTCDGYPHNIYMHEWRDDLYGKFFCNKDNLIL